LHGWYVEQTTEQYGSGPWSFFRTPHASFATASNDAFTLATLGKLLAVTPGPYPIDCVEDSVKLGVTPEASLQCCIEHAHPLIGSIGLKKTIELAFLRYAASGTRICCLNKVLKRAGLSRPRRASSLSDSGSVSARIVRAGSSTYGRMDWTAGDVRRFEMRPSRSNSLRDRRRLPPEQFAVQALCRFSHPQFPLLVLAFADKTSRW
jgi:hypothetical protein